MSNDKKVNRRQAILHILGSNNIEKQDELLVELKQIGIKTTQSTLSRDLQEMHIVRVPLEDKSYKYVFKDEDKVSTRLLSIFKEAVTDIGIQEYFVYIKTLDGMASSVGEMIDTLDNIKIAGTIAGNNNIFVLCKGIEAAKEVYEELNALR